MNLIYYFDLDNTLCKQYFHALEYDYKKAIPFEDRIKKVNELYREGHTINIWTSRGMSTGLDWKEVTENQLKTWGLNYHNLIMHKPYYNIFVEDKAIHPNDFFKDKQSEVIHV